LERLKLSLQDSRLFKDMAEIVNSVPSMPASFVRIQLQAIVNRTTHKMRRLQNNIIERDARITCLEKKILQSQFTIGCIKRKLAECERQNKEVHEMHSGKMEVIPQLLAQNKSKDTEIQYLREHIDFLAQQLDKPVTKPQPPPQNNIDKVWLLTKQSYDKLGRGQKKRYKKYRVSRHLELFSTK
jgi:hypothetical protein